MCPHAIIIYAHLVVVIIHFFKKRGEEIYIYIYQWSVWASPYQVIIHIYLLISLYIYIYPSLYSIIIHTLNNAVKTTSMISLKISLLGHNTHISPDFLAYIYIYIHERDLDYCKQLVYDKIINPILPVKELIQGILMVVPMIPISSLQIANSSCCPYDFSSITSFDTI